MTRWTVDIGLPRTAHSQQANWVLSSPYAHEIPGILGEGGATRYLAQISIRRDSRNAIILDLAPTADANEVGAELSASWQSTGSLSLTVGSRTIKVGPPSDTTDPYWWPQSEAGGLPAVTRWLAYVEGRSQSGQRATLTLDDNAPDGIASRASGVLPRLSASARSRKRVLTPSEVNAITPRLFAGSQTGHLWRINPANPSDTTAPYGDQGASVAPRIDGLAFHKGKLYATSYTNTGTSLYLINPENPTDTTGNYGLIGALPSGLQTPISMASHNGKLYIADSTGDELFRINETDPSSTTSPYGEVNGSGRGSLPRGLTTPAGMASHKGRLYIADSSGDELFDIDETDPDSTTGAYGKVGDLPSGLSSPQGMTSHDDKLFISDSSGSKLFQIDTTNTSSTTSPYGEVGGSGRGSFPSNLFTPNSLASLPPAPLVPPSFTDDSGDDQSWTAGSTADSITVPLATGNPLPTYAVVGRLPAGLAFNRRTRVLSGVPQTAATGTITIRATNAAGTADWTVRYAISTVRLVKASAVLPSLRGAARIGSPLSLNEFDTSRVSPPIVLGLITAGAQSSGTMYRQQNNQPRIGTLSSGSDFLLQGTQSVTRVAVFSNGAALRLWDNPSGDHLSAIFTAAAGYNVYIQTKAGLAKLTRGNQGGNFSNWATAVASEQAILRGLLVTGTRFILAIAKPLPVRFLQAVATLPTLAGSAKASRLVPVVRDVRASGTLPAVSSSARATRLATAAHSVRASATLPGIASRARATRTEAIARKVKATGELPTLATVGRVKRITASARSVRVLGVLPAIVGRARGSFVRSPIRKVRAAGTLPRLTGTARIPEPIAALHLTDFDASRLAPPIVLGLVTTGAQSGGTMYRQQPSQTRIGSLATGSDMLLQGTQSITRTAIYSNGGEMRLWDNPSGDHFSTLFTATTGYNVYVQTLAGVAMLTRGAQGGNFSRWTTTDSDEQAILRSLLTAGTQFIIAVATQPVSRDVRASATLPVLKGSARATRLATAVRSIRAAADLPALVAKATASLVRAPVRKARAAGILPSLAASARAAAPLAGLHLSDFDDTGLEPPIVLGLITTGVTTPAGTSSTVYLTIGGIHYLGSLAPGSDITLQEDQTITRLAVYTNGDQLQIWAASVIHDMASLFPSNTRYNVYIQTSAGLAVLDRGAQSGSSSLWTTTTADEQAILRSLLTRGTEFLIAVARQPGVRLARASASLPAVTASVKASRILPVVRDVRASAALPVLVGKARASRIGTEARILRAAATLPALTGTARAIRIVTVRSVRGSGVLPTLSGRGQIKRFASIVRHLKASAVLPSLSSKGLISQITAAARLVRASGVLPSLSGRGRLRHFTAAVRHVKASGRLHSLGGAARSSPTLALKRSLRAAGVLPQIDGSARIRQHRFVLHKIRASENLPSLDGAARLSRQTSPSAPAAPTIDYLLESEGHLSWPEPDDGGTPILSYQAQWRKVLTSVWSEEDANSPSLLLTALDGNSEYEFRVRATNAIGSGPYSALSTGTTKAIPHDDHIVEIDWNNNGRFDHPEANIAGDIIDIDCRYGRDYTSQTYGRSVAGTITIQLWNPGGKYNYSNASSPLAGLVDKPRRRIRVRMLNRGRTRHRSIWFGLIDRIKARPSRGGAHRATLYGYGILSTMRQYKVFSSMQIGLRTDQLANHAKKVSGWPFSLSAYRGSSTIKRWWSDNEELLQVLRDLENTEGGFLKEDPFGRGVLEGRNFRLSGSSLIEWTIFRDTASGIAIKAVALEEPFKDLANVAKATVRNYQVGSTAVLWVLPGTLRIAAKDSVSFRAQYPSGGVNVPTGALGVELWVDPVVNTDYVANSEASGSGANRTSALSVTITGAALSCHVVLRNTGATAIHVTKFQLRGQPVTQGSDHTVEYRASQADIDAYGGEQEYSIKAKWLDTINDARSYCEQVVTRHKQPTNRLNITIDVSPNRPDDFRTLASSLALSFRVAVIADGPSGLGIREQFYVESIRHRIQKPGYHLMEVGLGPIDANLANVIRLDVGPGLGTGVLGR